MANFFHVVLVFCFGCALSVKAGPVCALGFAGACAAFTCLHWYVRDNMLVAQQQQDRLAELSQLRAKMARSLLEPVEDPTQKIQQVAWLNKVVQLMWPALNKATSDSILYSVNGLLKDPAILPSFLTSLQLDKNLSLGPDPPLITGIRVRDRPGLDDMPDAPGHDFGSSPAADCPLGMMILDLDLEAQMVPEIELHVNAGGLADVPLSLSALTLTGTLRLQFDPLVGQWPSFAMLGYCFVEPPELDVQLDVHDIQV
jgi:Ca2+-dependent lipid-binding protein